MLHDSEPQTGPPLIPGAGGVRPVEPFEHPRQMMARDAGTVVRDGEQRATGGGTRGHDDATARWCVAQGVVEQVREDLPQGIRIGGEPGPVAWWRDGDGEVDPAVPSPVSKRHPGFAGDAGDIHRLEDGLPAARLDAREVEEIVHEALHAARVAEDGLSKPRALRTRSPRRRVERDDSPPRVRRQDAVRHRLDEGGRLLALAPQLGKPLIELLMHGAQREDVLRYVGGARLREARRLARGDGPRGAGQLDERPRDLS